MDYISYIKCDVSIFLVGWEAAALFIDIHAHAYRKPADIEIGLLESGNVGGSCMEYFSTLTL